MLSREMVWQDASSWQSQWGRNGYLLLPVFFFEVLKVQAFFKLKKIYRKAKHNKNSMPQFPLK
jgi:hypothetical protein